MSNAFDLKQAEALWLLGLLDTKTLPEMAMNALVNGNESDLMLKLAISSEDEIDFIERLFRQVLEEAGYGKMSNVDALRYYATQISISILSGDVSPLEGATLIWDASINIYDQIHDYHELDGFIYAASEMVDRPSDKDFFEKAIIEEAKELVSKGYC
jgi:hypothetical protein